ncbi:hypothetical protein GCM10011391_15000 [Pullulanibacillus camelliae]|uniref:Uncharacterized protein n=1 Tax=Pullulanibacillus camelliae TaxID=1707096 RepID=A0A8J2YG68_9BACL|nr:hypothetical protein GCM10011391_15000 [Pullulanibacillus camelliae]
MQTLLKQEACMLYLTFLSIKAICFAGFGTLHIMQVAGRHWASPSATLDKHLYFEYLR